MKHYGGLRVGKIGDRELFLNFNGNFDFMPIISFLQQTYEKLEVAESSAHNIHLIIRGFGLNKMHYGVWDAFTDAILYNGWEPYNPPGEDSRSEYYRYGYEAQLCMSVNCE